jgi:hypothetical protein
MMRRRWPRALRPIERDLARTDPGLDALFRSFARRPGGCDLSWVEQVSRRRFPWFRRRRHQRTLSEWMRDWVAEYWED